MQAIQKGFTLIELMIVIAIVGILAAIAVPQYNIHVQKGRFAEVIEAVRPFKLGVEVCVVQQGLVSGAITGCSAGQNGMPSNVTTPSEYVASVTVDAGGDGVITAQSTASVGTVTTYMLTPTLGGVSAAELIVWTTAGSGCLSLGLC